MTVSGPRLDPYLRRVVTRAVAVALAVISAAAGVRRHRTVSAVPPELRTPSLWLPLFVNNRFALSAGRRLFNRPTEPVAGVCVSRREITGGQNVFVYEPASLSGTTGALLWIHGGGMIIGSPEADHDLCSRIARDAGIRVISVRYRLAPEQPFPAGFDDCFLALRWLNTNADDWSVDPGLIAVGGASAGGGLAAAVAQKAHDEQLPVRYQVLIYPMLDDRTSLRRDHGGRGRIGWTPRSNTYAWTCYLGHRPNAGEPSCYASAARRKDLTGLSPAWIGVGELDLFHDEDVDYARRLEQAGVPVNTLVEPGMYHGADVNHAATVPSMRAFQQAMVNALIAGLDVEPTKVTAVTGPSLGSA